MPRAGSALRVLHVTTSFPLHEDHWSGVFVRRQVEALVDLGCEVTVLAPHAPGAATAAHLAAVPVERVRYLPERAQTLAYGGGIPANLRAHPARWFAVPPFAFALARAIRRRAADHDLIHAHWSFAGALATLPGVARGKPVVLSFHGTDLAREAGPFAVLARHAARRAAALVVHSDPMRDRAAALVGDSCPILQLPHGVDLRQFRPLAKPADAFVVVAVGRLSHEKGFDLLLRALAKSRLPEPWRLDLIGTGPLGDDLRRLARALHVTDRVRFLGALPPRLVAEHLGRAHAMAVPSRREGFSVVALEALAAGLPVVGARVGALPELINDGENGFLCETGDIDGFAAALTGLGDDPARRERFAIAARDTAMRYDIREVNRSLVRLYEELVPRGSRMVE